MNTASCLPARHQRSILSITCISMFKQPDTIQLKSLLLEWLCDDCVISQCRPIWRTFHHCFFFFNFIFQYFSKVKSWESFELRQFFLSVITSWVVQSSFGFKRPLCPTPFSPSLSLCWKAVCLETGELLSHPIEVMTPAMFFLGSSYFRRDGKVNRGHYQEMIASTLRFSRSQ